MGEGGERKRRAASCSTSLLCVCTVPRGGDGGGGGGVGGVGVVGLWRK